MGRLRLTGRTAIVTGARGGLGEALANTLESMGVKVQRISRGDEWNPTNYELLFLNAGFGMLQSSAKSFHNVADVQEMFDVNLLTPLRQAQHALENGAVHVHVVGSVLSIVSAPLYALYAASKHALRGWAYGAARELPGRVSISYPNGIATAYFANLRGDATLLAQYSEAVVHARHAYDTPEAVAAGILDGIRYGAREIIPTSYALEWFVRNGEDIRRMWHPGLTQPSVEHFDWWDAIASHYAEVCHGS